MKNTHVFFLIVAILLCSLLENASASPPVGIIKSVNGTVYLRSAKVTVKAVPHMRISQGDYITTDRHSSVGLIFEDDTVLSLGPNSEIIIESFLFNPADSELSFVARMVKGTFSFITGQIAKLAPTKVTLLTPEATLGVRGTTFLVKID